jgi:hypothetical protein
MDGLQPFRDEHEHGVGRRGLGPRAVKATIWAANPARLRGFCPCGAQPGGGDVRLDVVDFTAGLAVALTNTTVTATELRSGRRRPAICPGRSDRAARPTSVSG